MKASDMTPGSKVSMLLKAPWGFGKTIAAASCAVEGPVYIAYFDKSSPIEVFTFYKKHRPDLLDRIEYDIYGAHNAHEYLNKLIDFSRNGCRYVAVITDSLTNLTAAAVNWSLGFRDTRKRTDKINKDAPAIIPDFDEYKVETSLVTQALDICRSLPAHMIWTAHPLPAIKVEGAGASIKVTKVVSLVTYGSKVAGIVPGQFQEIYHFSKSIDYSTNPSTIKYTVNTNSVGDDFAKTALDLPNELDITNKLFWEVWKEALNHD